MIDQQSRVCVGQSLLLWHNEHEVEEARGIARELDPIIRKTLIFQDFLRDRLQLPVQYLTKVELIVDEVLADCIRMGPAFVVEGHRRKRHARHLP